MAEGQRWRAALGPRTLSPVLPGWIDSHCHIHDDRAFPDPSATLAEAKSAGVWPVVVIGTHPEDWHRAIAFCESHPGVRCALGWHPNMTADYSASSLDELRSLLGRSEVVGIGEMGLDDYWDYAPRPLQEEALEAQLALAKEVGLPPIFHVRNGKEPAVGLDAYARLESVLRRLGADRLGMDRFVVHCFAGSERDALAFLELGGYLGINGPVTYKKNEEFRQVVARLPRDRVVLETDSPYLSPVPHRGKPNQPAYVPLIGATIAELWGCSVEEVASQTSENARRLFGL